MLPRVQMRSVWREGARALRLTFRPAEMRLAVRCLLWCAVIPLPLSCGKSEPPNFVLGRPPASAAYFFVPADALNVVYYPRKAPAWRESADYYVRGAFPPSGLLSAMEANLAHQKWYEAKCDLEMPAWKPGVRSLTHPGSSPGDKLLTKWWIREQGDVLSLHVFFFAAKAARSEPAIKVALRHWESDRVREWLERYREAYGLPWERATGPESATQPDPNSGLGRIMQDG
jgi:hypothetical protein